jgi:hypothetical protein
MDGAAAVRLDSKKNHAYKRLAPNSNGYPLVPFPVETYGRLGQLGACLGMLRRWQQGT